MDEQIIIVCDDQGNPTGEYIPKIEGISGDGVKHLAVSVLLYNSKGEVLIQKRKHKVFDNLWDVTASTDVSHFKEGQDESLEEAVKRCLKREYNIEGVNNLKNLGGFSYFAKDGDHCENEYDVMWVAEYNGEFTLNPEVGYEYKWMRKEEFLKDIKANPQNYTPWAIHCSSFL